MNLPLHLLVNNAGIMALPTRESTAQGLEQQVGVCHVAHFLLTKTLLPAIQAARDGSYRPRVVCLSSVAYKRHGGVNWVAHPKLETEPYREWTAYGNAKLGNLLMARELDRKYSSEGVDAFSVMPGGIHTGLQGHVDIWTKLKWLVVTPFFFKSVSQGAATTLLCATSPTVQAHGGQYFDNCAVTTVVATLEKELGSGVGGRCWDATERLLAELGF
eukprot:TRINITY_DN32970_c0_g1_i1.p1 TRINITY_DN32970_c0_g1~~TRINITY_DN32970_c0_g1_i1.p1  ORF type:complete len:216 (-),score=57.90 TRINITY_DN32970_c0_g1_i1:110-757(-)